MHASSEAYVVCNSIDKAVYMQMVRPLLYANDKAH